MNHSSDDLYDEWLVLRCRRRDAEAWAELVDRYHDRLTYFISRLVEPDHVEAVMQETWLGVLNGLRRLKSAQRFAPWVYAIARNQAMRRLRRKYRASPGSLDRVEQTLVDPDTEAATTQFENAEAVHQALASVSLVHREILTLFFLDDLSIEETSQLLGVPTGTVKSRLYRAKAELADILKSEGSF